MDGKTKGLKDLQLKVYFQKYKKLKCSIKELESELNVVDGDIKYLMEDFGIGFVIEDSEAKLRLIGKVTSNYTEDGKNRLKILKSKLEDEGQIVFKTSSYLRLDFK